MTGPEDSQSSSRPISVAELLAKNGTIGAPPIGGRRRRRRGDTDSVTVAELTGEIPIVRDHDADEPATGRTSAVVVEEPIEAPEPSDGAAEEAGEEPGEDEPAEVVLTSEGTVDEAVEDVVEEADEDAVGVPDEADEDLSDEADEDLSDAEADYAAHLEERDARDVVEDLDFFAPARRSGTAPRRRDASATDAAVGAEQMSPDPVDWSDPDGTDDTIDADAAVDLDERDEDLASRDDDRDDLPSYLRSSESALFGGPTVDDDVRRDTRPGPEDLDIEEDEPAPAGAMSTVLHGAWVVGQCILAVAFGAGLFVAFDQLWNWNSIVALVLGVLVILGLVVGVRVVRKTEDIASTLIAVAVGALVTFGPLALMKA
ncbi:hypothetical protein [Mycobacterium sp. IDR2000157661]|uniref:hypothetical protein n=1 Tax=Mycobacterium sp. IDR2000157661 TaxID=2867005 RepID=UPI001EECE2DF|nr:hypothetical protein [Mycobacterium sp. IDR2000157661]ULE34205.1 hypothetical protein K3G64_06015 [Mycobacterium sp. IDR2000157661]